MCNMIIHTSKKVVCDIEHCFGLNDKEIKYVSINDPAQVMGIDTVLQGIARACRSKNENPIGTADISRASLKLFNHLGSTSLDTLHATEDMQIVVKRKKLWCDIQREEAEREEAEREERKEKDKAYNELILMRCEDLRLIQKRREEKWGVFCNKLVDICDFSSFRTIFIAFRNYCSESKQMKYEEEKRKNIIRKQNIKKLKKGFKKLINVQTKVTFNELKTRMLFRRMCLNDTLFFFDFENNYYPNLSEWDSFRDFV